LKEFIHTYQKVVAVSLPLVMSTSTTMIMEFTDRIFLARYDLEAIAAALPAGITAYLFIAFFAGVAGYLNVFIAQYQGAGMSGQVGACVWQGIYFSLIAGLLLAALSFFAIPIFRFTGHSPGVQHLEVVYFRILCLGAGAHVLGTALSCFFSGRGDTRPVMIVHFLGTAANIPLDYAMINGVWGFPELGIVGAGLATVCSWVVIALLFGLLVFQKKWEGMYRIRKSWSPDPELLRRLIRFGVPGAVQFSLDIMAFTFFVLMVGRIGDLELAVTNIVLSINSIAYMPMMGVSLGTSTLVGLSLGAGRVDDAREFTRCTVHLVLVYIALLASVFLLVPEVLLGFFRPQAMTLSEFVPVSAMGSALLVIVSAYLFFDALYMVFIGTLKGAGDTRFIMLSIGGASLFVLVIPLFIGIRWLGGGLYFSWGCLAFFVFSLFVTASFRYCQGKWSEMSVIRSGKVV
jgi:MATE family multidrug resistance protein